LFLAFNRQRAYSPLDLFCGEEHELKVLNFIVRLYRRMSMKSQVVFVSMWNKVLPNLAGSRWMALSTRSQTPVLQRTGVI